MKRRNESLQKYFETKKVPKWRVAERMGIADSSLSRLLRYEIPQEKEDEIRKHIDAVANELVTE